MVVGMGPGRSLVGACQWPDKGLVGDRYKSGIGMVGDLLGSGKGGLVWAWQLGYGRELVGAGKGVAGGVLARVW